MFCWHQHQAGSRNQPPCGFRLNTTVSLAHLIRCPAGPSCLGSSPILSQYKMSPCLSVGRREERLGAVEPRLAHTHVHAHTQADMHYNLYLCGSAPAHVLGRICCNLSNVVIFFFHTMYSRLRNGLGNDSFTAPLLRQSPSYVVGEIITNNLSRLATICD